MFRRKLNLFKITKINLDCFFLKKMSSNVAISKLVEYIKIKSVHPEPDYGLNFF